MVGKAPDISVVMSAYNSADTITHSLASVLEQEDVDLELVVVNDGSTDATADRLRGAAKEDPRVRVFHQENRGLTRSLIRACAEARGRFMARQDAGGDRSLRGRLAREAVMLESDADLVMVSCGTRFVDPDGELLYESRQIDDDAEVGLNRLSLEHIRGPSHHGSTMFRRDAYLTVGGYRGCFAVAQDLDLWLRFAELGRIAAMPDVLYEAVLAPQSISALQRREQLDTTRAILECARHRRAGRSEEEPLGRLPEASAARPATVPSQRLLSDYYYFLGRCLQERNRSKAKRYYQRALRAFPLNLKALFFLARTHVQQDDD